MKGIRALQSKLRAIFILVIMCCAGCAGKTDLYPAGYLKWMNDPANGMVTEKEISGLIYELRYLTPEAMALNELRKTNPGKEEFENTRKDYGHMSYFKMRMFCKDGSHIHEYLKKIGQEPYGIEAYLNYYAQKDWIMTVNGDTAKCTLFTFAKSYGASNEFDMEMAFPYADSLTQNDLSVEWDDKATGNGNLKFLFKSRDLQRIPQIRI